MNRIALDVLECPLSGINLIEASAGTGKTWTLVALYLRLLLEEDASQGIPTVDQVLVVTYTRAATAELRDRLRRGLDALLHVLLGGCTDDPFLATLAQRVTAYGKAQRAIRRVSAALRGFDAAAIYTIHGFCQRVLGDTAFESGYSFAAEALEDDTERLAEIVDDFWRLYVVTDPGIARIVVEQKESPDQWLVQVRPYISRTYLTMSIGETIELAPAMRALDTAWDSLRCCMTMVEEGLACFLQYTGLHARQYSTQLRTDLAEELVRLLREATFPILSRSRRDRLMKLTPAALTAATKKGWEPLQHSLFARMGDWLTQWDAYAKAAQQRIAQLKLELIRWANVELARRCQAVRSRRFDDLLMDLAMALSSPDSGARLAKRIAHTFRVVLVDEFQDTDPIQYAIFRAIFIESACPIFFVGDPKQAIYSFRGADIFTYLKARADAHNYYSLDTNRRSIAPLVDAVNTLFSRSQPYLLPEIDYHPVNVADSSITRLEMDDDKAPFCIQWMDFSHTKKGASKETAADYAAQLTATEVAKLLTLSVDGRARLVGPQGTVPLTGGDIAILVMTHHQGTIMREALHQRGIASATLTQQSVFESREAREFLALLRAWAAPASDNLLKAVLTTELGGVDSTHLLKLVDDESSWDKRRQLNAEDHQRWLAHGFMVAWRTFFAREHLAERLLPLPDGKRRLTNFAHLAELLQRESEQYRGLAPLLAWFETCMVKPPRSEEAMLRLEDDVSLVKIVTVHSAKGLQYPIVFCPFLWDGALERQGTAFWLYHDRGHTHLVPDTLADDSVRCAARAEMFAEKLRLLYVALTRAQYRQYLAWGWVQKIETAALSWLLHCQAFTHFNELATHTLVVQTIESDIKSFIDAAPDYRCCATDKPTDEWVENGIDHPSVYRARMLTRELKAPWWITSYSALVRHVYTAKVNEQPDHEEGTWDVPDPICYDRFHFPRGARAGTCLHAIFESIYKGSQDTIPSLIRSALQRFGIAPEWQDAAHDMVNRVFAVPLDSDAVLGKVMPDKSLVEFEFLFPVEKLDGKQLIALLSHPDNGLHPLLRKAALTLDVSTVVGFLKGFIDLVVEINGRIYLIDYKSNYLGGQAENYGDAALAYSIANEHYYLQYLIYCVALKRYFASRGITLASCFGGVRYLYLRGLDHDGNGVWRDQPRGDLIDKLDRLFGCA